MMTTTAHRALKIFKRKCRHFKIEVNVLSEKLNTATEGIVQQIICCLGVEWESLSSSYDEPRIQYPEAHKDEDLVLTEGRVLHTD